MQTIVYHSKARKTMCGMGTFCLIGMISFQLTMQNGESFGVNPSSPGFPGVWGHVFTNNGNRYGTATGDNYYLIITAAGGLLIGTQVNNSTTITWYSATVTPL